MLLMWSKNQLKINLIHEVARIILKCFSCFVRRKKICHFHYFIPRQIFRQVWRLRDFILLKSHLVIVWINFSLSTPADAAKSSQGTNCESDYLFVRKCLKILSKVGLCSKCLLFSISRSQMWKQR